MAPFAVKRLGRTMISGASVCVLLSKPARIQQERFTNITGLRIRVLTQLSVADPKVPAHLIRVKAKALTKAQYLSFISSSRPPET